MKDQKEGWEKMEVNKKAVELFISRTQEACRELIYDKYKLQQRLEHLEEAKEDLEDGGNI